MGFFIRIRYREQGIIHTARVSDDAFFIVTLNVPYVTGSLSSTSISRLYMEAAMAFRCQG